MATIKGKGIVWGVNGITFTAGVVSATTENAMQSARHARTSESVEIVDGNGDTVAKAFYNLRRVLSVTVIPYHDTTLAGAVTSLDAYHLAPGTLVTVVDADGAIVDDNYNVLSATQSRTNTSAAAVDLELEAFDANEVATAPIT